MEAQIFDFGSATAIIFMTVLGLSLAVILSIANKYLFVYEDPRIDEVDEMLPHNNCGACGVPGCRTFAEHLVNGETIPAKCTVNTKEGNQLIADYLGVDMGTEEKRVARLACAGGTHVSFTRAAYQGMSSCQAASVISGGGKGCTWGCLGLGDCADVCDFDAIKMNKFGLPVVNEDLCTACEDCVATCPKDLFDIQAVSNQLWVACKNQQFDEDAIKECEVACTACEKCAKDSPEGLIEIVNNLAVVDYSKKDLLSKAAIERCPTGAIVWLDQNGNDGTNDGTIKKGKKAKPVLRKSALPVG